MKKILSLICVLLLASSFLCIACGNEGSDNNYLRIHIRANSNLQEDQAVKYKVKEVLVDYLTPCILKCNSFNEVVEVVEDSKEVLEDLADNVLVENGFTYKSSVEIDNEFFPTRAYENFTLESDYYDAIIVNLGSGDGDNWWCVVYPPLCFKDTKNVVYKSKIKEIINKFF